MDRRDFLKNGLAVAAGTIALGSMGIACTKTDDKKAPGTVQQAPVQEAYTFIMLELDAHFCSAEALVNGIPVARSTPDGVIKTQLPVHEYLMPEKNKITLVVEPGATPSHALEPRGIDTYEPKAWAHIIMRQMPQGSFPEDPEVKQLLKIEFMPPPGNPVPMQKPFLREAEISGFPFAKRWRWMDASPITMSPLITDQVIKFLQPIFDGLSKKNPEPFIRVAQIRFDEITMAYKPLLDNLRELFRKDLKEDYEKPGFKFEPIDNKMLDLRLCGNSNVIDCVDVNWEPIIRGIKREDGKRMCRYPVKVAFIDGKLQIVR